MKPTHSRSVAAVKRFAAAEDGATAIEYAMIAACISIAIVTTAITLGETVRDDLFGKVDTALQTATTPPAP
jgi:pilus assembly protein Flp/PilA